LENTPPPGPWGKNVSRCHFGEKYEKGENVREKEERGGKAK
jgi:hypothetical protein